MNLLLSQLTSLPVAPGADDAPLAQPAAGDVPQVLDTGTQAQPAFNDALLGIINALMGGEQQRDTAMVLADVKAAADDDEHKTHQRNASPRVEDLIGSPQQLLDALLAASQMPVKTLNATSASTPRGGDALTLQNMTVGQPVNATPLGVQAQPAVANVTPEPIADAVKPTVPDLAKPVMSLIPVAGQTAAGQTFTHAVEKQAVNLPPIKMDADEAKWAQQLHGALNDRLQLQVRNQVQHATIRLDPPEMGKVDISLQIENGRMQVHISASNGETYRALQQISNELRQSLTEQNFVQVNVQVSSQSGQSQQGHKEQQMLAAQESPAAGAEIAAEETQATFTKDDSVLLTV
ncbi:flagellar hook-length control protein FliK [Enterobacter soli]|uniref:flagellar hook-length control protein FliK n=1 Tax=Enterobacter soli TaxID=885040 RepID=UPI0034D01769